MGIILGLPFKSTTIKPFDMEWISVSDRLPVVGEYVLCYCNTDFVVAAYHDKTSIWGTEYKNVWILNLDVESCLPTHWMPIPEPPKE